MSLPEDALAASHLPRRDPWLRSLLRLLTGRPQLEVDQRPAPVEGALIPPPEGVHLRWPDGGGHDWPAWPRHELTPRYQRTDRHGVHVWRVDLTPQEHTDLLAGLLVLQVDVLPARTEVRTAVIGQ